MSDRGGALLAAALTGVQVGAALVASRAVVAELSPATLALLRYAIGLGLLLPAWLWVRRATGSPPPMPGRDRIAVAALGVLQFGLPIVMLNAALQRINANLTALLFATFPLMTLLLGAALGRERLQPVVRVGVLASVAGVAVALGGGVGVMPGRSAAAAAVGVGLALAAAAGCALCSVLVRPYLARHGARRVGVLAMAASVAALLLPALAEGGLAQAAVLSPRGWALVLFVGASSGAGYLLWLWALAHLAATRAAVFQALAPLTAAVLGHLLLGEAWTPALSLGLLGVMAGLWLSTRRP